MEKATRKLCLLAMGTALFVVLSLCLQVPVFENYYLCLGYVPMMVFCYYFGPAAGMTVGCGGVILYCLLINGLRGMPGWAAGNLLIGLVVGLTCRITAQMKNRGARHLLLAASVVVAVAVGILGVKSAVEMLLYAQPIWLRMGKNLYAFAADVVVLLVSLPICASLEKVIYSKFGDLCITR